MLVLCNREAGSVSAVWFMCTTHPYFFIILVACGHDMPHALMHHPDCCVGTFDVITLLLLLPPPLPQAVLLENAFVIQLWHYSEHTYFKGASVLAATAVAYREQLVWVQLLGCIHQLKVSVCVGGGGGVACVCVCVCVWDGRMRFRGLGPLGLGLTDVGGSRTLSGSFFSMWLQQTLQDQLRINLVQVWYILIHPTHSSDSFIRRMRLTCPSVSSASQVVFHGQHTSGHISLHINTSHCHTVTPSLLAV